MDSNSALISTSAAPSKKGKSLIPWRDTTKGPSLRLAMFRLAVVERIYFKSSDDKRKADDRWQDFANKLFAQPEFMGMDGSFRSIKEQYFNTLNDRAKHHGWMDANGGITGNLSDHAGDLDPLDQAIKDCLVDKEHLENEKELKKDLAKELNTKEGDLIQGQLSKEAKENRQKNTLKYKLPSAPNDDTSSSSSLSSPSTTNASSSHRAKAPRVSLQCSSLLCWMISLFKH